MVDAQGVCAVCGVAWGVGIFVFICDKAYRPKLSALIEPIELIRETWRGFLFFLNSFF